MELSLTERTRQLLALLLTVPPRFDEAKTYLSQHPLSADELTKAGICYADNCFLDFDDYIRKNMPEDLIQSTTAASHGIIPELHSAYIYDVVKFLLQYGLDPNAVYETQYSYHNIMYSILHIDHGYLAADTMLLLLENGGNPNLTIDTESIFEIVDYDVWFGSIEQETRWRYDLWVHLWMVMVACGGEIPGKGPLVEVFKEYASGDMFDLKKLRNHRNYYFGLSIENKERTMRVYDRKTLWEVVKW